MRAAAFCMYARHGTELRKSDPKFRAPRYEQYLAAVEALDHFAREHFERGVLELALRWLLDRPGVSMALWGARRPEQLDPVARVMDWHLSDDDFARIDAFLDERIREPVGPEFMAPPSRRERGLL